MSTSNSNNNQHYQQLPSVRNLVPITITTTTTQTIGTSNTSQSKTAPQNPANFAIPQNNILNAPASREEQDERSSVLNFACQECRRAHKACSKTRPCSRCAKLGLACGSIHRKKRVGKGITPKVANINTAKPIVQNTVAAVSRSLQQQQSVQQQIPTNVPSIQQCQLPQISVQAVPLGNSSNIMVPPQMTMPHHHQYQLQHHSPPPNENFASLHAYQSPNTLQNLEQPIAYRRFAPADLQQVPSFHFNHTMEEEQYVTTPVQQQQQQQQQQLYYQHTPHHQHQQQQPYVQQEKDQLLTMMAYKMDAPQVATIPSTNSAQADNYQENQQLPSIRSLDEWNYAYNPKRPNNNDWQ